MNTKSTLAAVALAVAASGRGIAETQPAAQAVGLAQLETNAAEEGWIVEEIRAGRPFISAATQDQFVPQMVNLEKLGGVDFQKGCYPGQEIVARAQYRGEVKRRMVRLPAPAGAAPNQPEPAPEPTQPPATQPPVAATPASVQPRFTG